jgi:hypothetical protein
MPLVFVHGVSVRRDEDYDQLVAARNSLFRRFALKQLVADPMATKIFNPYWGDDGVKFAWNSASLPRRGGEAFGGEDELAYSFLADTPDIATPKLKDEWLLDTARRSGLTAAIDLLWSAAAYSGKQSTSDELAVTAKEAMEYVETNPSAEWLGEVANDEEFVGKLFNEVSKRRPNMEAFGGREILDRLREAADRVALSAGKATSSSVLAFGRRGLNKFLATFMGDIITYVNDRGSDKIPGPIVQTVSADLNAASLERKQTGEPLLVVAHSMGGNIVYDILSYFQPDLHVDVLVTVGSQVGLFEEMKMFRVRNIDIPDPKDSTKGLMPKPPGLNHWLNVYDFNDVLSFGIEKIFEGSRDYPYSTGGGLILAHIRYFTRPSFHDHLGKRLAEVWK